MAVSVQAFMDSLNASGLMTSEQTATLLEQNVADSGESMAGELVAQGTLTKYQAHAICTGQTRHLVLGEYRILDQIGHGGMGQVFKALEQLAELGTGAFQFTGVVGQARRQLHHRNRDRDDGDDDQQFPQRESPLRSIAPR